MFVFLKTTKRLRIIFNVLVKRINARYCLIIKPIIFLRKIYSKYILIFNILLQFQQGFNSISIVLIYSIDIFNIIFFINLYVLILLFFVYIIFALYSFIYPACTFY